MTMQSTTLRPGLLVSLKTSLRGNVSYNKKVLEADHKTKDGASQSRWEMERLVANPKEHRRAKEVRSKAATAIRRVCALSAFGLLCPESKAEELDAAIKEAHRLVDDFNSKAELSRLFVGVITGRIAPDDVEAVKAINSEIRDLMTDMADGVKNLDVKSVREAANRVRQIGTMLPPEAEARVQIAIETARKAAREIVKAGETAAAEIDRGAVRKITEMRTTFLELDEIKQVQKPKSRGRALDLQTEIADAGGIDIRSKENV